MCNEHSLRRQKTAAAATLPRRKPIRRAAATAFSARPAAYQLNHQAENFFMFPHLELF
jgi:hypothetical protein